MSLSPEPIPPDEAERRFPRRFLLSAGGAAAAVGVTQVVGAAPAAAAKKPWVLGGNSGAGKKDYLGTNDSSPLLFATKGKEQMRLTSQGRLGVGVNNPETQVDVVTEAGIGVRALSENGTGLQGLGQGENASGVTGAGIGSGTMGVYGTVSGTQAYGVRGRSNAADSWAVYGLALGPNSRGVTGIARGTGTGVIGEAEQPESIGVYASALEEDSYALYIEASKSSSYGLFAYLAGSQTAVYSRSNSGKGVHGRGDSLVSGYGVYSEGNCHVTGFLSKSSGAFKIDHPLDPEHQWLQHSFVESPDMLNVYNGNVVLDGDGTATVVLPDYFAALNRDYRYQLTCIGGHAPVYIASEVADNAFTIAGGTAGLKVSWQVTGIRQDDFAQEHPIVVEQLKSAEHSGTRQFVPKGSSARPMKHDRRVPAAS